MKKESTYIFASVFSAMLLALFLGLNNSMNVHSISETSIELSEPDLTVFQDISEEEALLALAQVRVLPDPNESPSNNHPLQQFPTIVEPVSLDGELTFESTRTGLYDLYVQAANGGSPAQPVLLSPWADVTPVLSPDGTQIAFASNRNGNYDIFLLNQAGEIVNLTQNPAEDIHPAWSPSGDKIIFSSLRSGSYYQIFTMNPDGSNVQQIGTIAGNAGYPHFSPNGSQISYMRASVTVPICLWNWDVWVMNANGTNQQQITTHIGGDLYPNWTPDGKIIYGGCHNFIDSDLYIIDPNTGVETQVNSWLFSNEWGAVYSPDSASIAFNSDYDVNVEIFVATLSQGTAFNLTQNSADDLAASWHPDPDIPPVTYSSISGRVTDKTGNPIPSVFISTNEGYVTTTDNKGEYVLNSLTAGTYTLTASKSGYVFSPFERVVEVPPDRQEQNFERVPTGPVPIVMVHGFGGLKSVLFNDFGCTAAYKTLRKTLSEANEYFGPLDQRLAESHPVYYARLVSNRCYTPKFDGNVQYLKEAIDQAIIATGHPKVILVAHSMGGLVSRAYIENEDLYRDDVQSLFTLGSPHHGIPLEIVKFIANGLLEAIDVDYDWDGFCNNLQPGMCQFSITGMSAFNAGHHLNGDVEYYFLTGDPPDYALNPAGLATDILYLNSPNDGIVAQYSGIGDYLSVPSNGFLQYMNDENHNYFGGLYYNWPYFGPRRNFLQETNSKVFTECLGPILANGQTNCVIPDSRPNESETSGNFGRTLIETGVLTIGEVATRTITVEDGHTQFVSQWTTGTLTMTLVAPNNLVIDPIYAEVNPSVVSYTVSTNGAAYTFPDALSGSWRVILQAGDIPQTGTTYATLVGLTTDYILVGGTDQPWYAPGETMILTATLGGSPLTGAITATIVVADGTSETLPLSPFGNGHYQLDYTVPAIPGYTEIQLAASGTTSDGFPFDRGLGLAIQIMPSTFTLNNTYSDIPNPYPGFSTLFQSLTVNVGINAIINGTVGLSADLVDGNGNLVAHAMTIQEANIGVNTLVLRFDGVDIYASQLNGPYTLTNLLLTDQTNTTLVTQEAEDVYNTPPYLYTNFSPPKEVFIPVVQR